MATLVKRFDRLSHELISEIFEQCNYNMNETTACLESLQEYDFDDPPINLSQGQSIPVNNQLNSESSLELQSLYDGFFEEQHKADIIRLQHFIEQRNDGKVYFPKTVEEIEKNKAQDLEFPELNCVSNNESASKSKRKKMKNKSVIMYGNYPSIKVS